MYSFEVSDGPTVLETNIPGRDTLPVNRSHQHPDKATDRATQFTTEQTSVRSAVTPAFQAAYWTAIEASVVATHTSADDATKWTAKQTAFKSAQRTADRVPNQSAVAPADYASVSATESTAHEPAIETTHQKPHK